MSEPVMFRVPLDALRGGDAKSLNVGVDHTDVPVVIISDLETRGAIQQTFSGVQIALREMNEQVLLHELLHVALLRVGVIDKDDPQNHNVIARIEVALWETGWRLAEPPFPSGFHP